MTRATWTVADRHDELDGLARDGVEVLVIGGGITGAGIVRDAALRGLSVALVEREDFASGTSSYTSKMIHGGLRYIAEAQFGVTRESCIERDRLASLHPNLVAPLPFMFCAFRGQVPRWKMLAGLSLYSALSGFKHGFRVLSDAEIASLSHDVDRSALRGASLYYDQQVDDARLVLETVKDARRAGARAVHHAEVVGLLREGTRVVGARVRDRLRGHELTLRAEQVVNATGPNVDRVRDLESPPAPLGIRPAKGVHLVIDRTRVHADAAIAFQAEDGRHIFLCPWGGVHLIGTTDTFTDAVDAPRVTHEDARYLLAATRRVFPRAKLNESDIVSAFAGVRPLVAAPEADRPPSSVSREHHIERAPSGLLSVAGGKLTTYRAMGEQIVDLLVKELPAERRAALSPCQTRERPVRDDAFDRDQLAAEVADRYALPRELAERLCVTWGKDIDGLLEASAPESRARIDGSPFLLAEVHWAIAHECAASLCDVLQRRVRVAMRARGQGLGQLETIGAVAQRAAGWSDAETDAQREHYREVVAQRYTVQA